MLRFLLLNHYVRGLHRLAPVLGLAYSRNRLRDSGLGVKMRFDLREPNECYSFFYFADDLWIRSWKNFLSPGDAFIDVGANAGFYCTHVATFVGPSGKVFGVEPNPAMVARLEEAARENALGSMTIVNAAASDFQGDAVLLVGSDHGLTRLQTDANQLTGIEVVTEKNVAVISLDSLAARLDGKPLRGIKLDIEGHEYRALLGGRQLLSRFRPLVQMEFNPTLMRQYGIEPEDIRGLFESLDYVFLAPQPPHSLCFRKSAVALKRYVPGSEGWSGSDLWACPMECEEDLRNAWQSATL